MRQEAPRTTPVRRWSARLGKLASIDVYVHPTFLLLLAWFGGAKLFATRSWEAAALEVVFVLCLFGCIVFHELGHALVARRFGIETRDITLYPIGGVAKLERMPENPRHELAIAFTGPLVNVAIALGLGAALAVWPILGSLRDAAVGQGSLVVRLLVANLALAVFNLLPAFPMDGGRVARALLTPRLGRAGATRAAARIGRAMAVVFGVLGVLGAPMLLLVAAFVWIAGAHEARAAEIDDALRDRLVGGAMETRFDVLRPADPLSQAQALVLLGPQVDFPIVDAEGVFGGLVGPEDIARGLASGEPSTPVAAVARVDVPRVRPEQPLREALERLSAGPWRTAAVVDPWGRLLGLLSSDNVAELVMFHEATALRRGPSPTRPSSTAAAS
jgi:Zn-dependent protease